MWVMHTHVAEQLPATPRLLLDSEHPGSGKTTVLEHLAHLCPNPLLSCNMSGASLSRLLATGPRTVLCDEVQRLAKTARVDLWSVVNNGYRPGATRTVAVNGKGGWTSVDLPTFAPVAMAGISPELADDTLSRSIRLVCRPDFDGVVADSDWYEIGESAATLAGFVGRWADSVREDLVERRVTIKLPAGCIGRGKDKWRPLLLVAATLGDDDWPARVFKLAARDVAHAAAEREAAAATPTASEALMRDLAGVWVKGQAFMATAELAKRLTSSNPGRYGNLSPVNLGRSVKRACEVAAVQPRRGAARGFRHADLAQVWPSFGVAACAA
jgi:hypothetical protein